MHTSNTNCKCHFFFGIRIYILLDAFSVSKEDGVVYFAGQMYFCYADPLALFWPKTPPLSSLCIFPGIYLVPVVHFLLLTNASSNLPWDFPKLFCIPSSSTTTCMQGRPGAPRAGRFTDEEEDSGADSMNDVMSSKSSHSCRWGDIPRGLHLYTLSQVLGFTDATTPFRSSLSRPWIRSTSRLWVLLWGLLCPFLPLPLLPTKPASGSSYAFQYWRET